MRPALQLRRMIHAGRRNMLAAGRHAAVVSRWIGADCDPATAPRTNVGTPPAEVAAITLRPDTLTIRSYLLRDIMKRTGYQKQDSLT